MTITWTEDAVLSLEKSADGMVAGIVGGNVSFLIEIAPKSHDDHSDIGNES